MVMERFSGATPFHRKECLEALPHRNLSEAQALLCSELWEIKGAKGEGSPWSGFGDLLGVT